jgi:hypothetical protein
MEQPNADLKETRVAEFGGGSVATLRSTAPRDEPLRHGIRSDDALDAHGRFTVHQASRTVGRTLRSPDRGNGERRELLKRCSCFSRKMSQTALNLTEQVLTHRLRAQLAYDVTLLGTVARLLVESVLGWYQRHLRISTPELAQSGVVVAVPRARGPGGQPRIAEENRDELAAAGDA